jgi:hypothetical protein
MCFTNFLLTEFVAFTPGRTALRRIGLLIGFLTRGIGLLNLILLVIRHCLRLYIIYYKLTSGLRLPITFGEHKVSLCR